MAWLGGHKRECSGDDKESDTETLHDGHMGGMVLNTSCGYSLYNDILGTRINSCRPKLSGNEICNRG